MHAQIPHKHIFSILFGIAVGTEYRVTIRSLCMAGSHESSKNSSVLQLAKMRSFRGICSRLAALLLAGGTVYEVPNSEESLRAGSSVEEPDAGNQHVRFREGC
jgi:hypothetical protein